MFANSRYLDIMGPEVINFIIGEDRRRFLIHGASTQIISRLDEDVPALSPVCDLALHRLQRLDRKISARVT
ncbi:hypothetical protein BJY01DRAFT_227469 [Aspergillus pseudoustus]|uniref:Uncharacterized protein n=1 Tax=Aspergillus pseudoustus TaxID=1810923 RepID=A0ABR4IQS9_9EURO